MKYLLLAAVIAVAAPIGAASAFQVITPEQMQDSGMGLAEGRYFSPEQRAQNEFQGSGQVQFFGNDRSRSSARFYGRADGGGRFFGDSRRSSSQGCDYAESNVGRLDAMSGRGYAYPCQRFR